jgi:hypothetical protein
MTAEIAVLVSPEEAEELIPVCRNATKGLVHLLAYATPVTQKMLQFNDLKYYAVPALPAKWSPPMWLKIQIGLFAGRLYFPFEELAPIRELLGLENEEAVTSRNDLSMELDGLQIDNLESSDDHQATVEDEQQIVPPEEAMTKVARAAKIKATRMLTFLQAWLGTRGRGQDFTHTPMGYICTRKPLAEDHPFFNVPDDDDALRSRVQQAMAGDTSVFAEMDDGKDDDDNSDIEEVELDPRHRLTEEEMKMSKEVDAQDGESEDDEGYEDPQDMEEDDESKEDNSKSDE